MTEEITTTANSRGKRKNAGSGAGRARKSAGPEGVRKGAGVEGRRKGAGADGARKGAQSGGEGRPEVTARDLMYAVSRAAAGFEAALKRATPALSMSQWAMLETLAQDEAGARPSQISRKLGFSRQLIRQAAKKLSKLGLIEAEAPEEGKKAVALRVTDAGKTTLTEIGAMTEIVSSAMADGKGGGNLGGAARTLKNVSAAIEAQAPKREKKPKADKPVEETTAEDAVEA